MLKEEETAVQEMIPAGGERVLCGADESVIKLCVGEKILETMYSTFFLGLFTFCTCCILRCLVCIVVICLVCIVAVVFCVLL